ncbi:MAG: DUF6785 family protein [Planctomycetota bacterium]
MGEIDFRKQTGGGVTFRAVVLGLLLVSFLSAVVPYSDYYLHNTPLTGNHFPIGVVFLFLVLCLGVNTVVRRFFRGAELSPAELLTVWCMMLVSAGLASTGLARYFFAMLIGPFYYATPQNRWAETIHRHIPKVLCPSQDPLSPVISHFFEGMPPDATIPWSAWQRPLILWGILLLMLYGLMFCLCTILRKQWADRERLNFPLIQLPVEMAAPPEHGSLVNSFFKSKAMWIGFIIPVFLYFLSGMNRLYWGRYWPQPRLFIWLWSFFSSEPWRHMRLMRLGIYPSIIGFTYLLTLEVSLSFWFFYFFMRLEYLLCAVLWEPIWGDYSSRAIHQQAGAFLMLAVLLLWRARSHLKDVAKKAFNSNYPVDDSEEPLSYRTAFFGLIGLTVGVCAWCSYLANMSVFFTLVALILLLTVLMVLTRVVAQGGLIFVSQNFQPYDIMTTTFGSATIGPSTLTVLAIQNIVFIHDSREVMMPNIMNSFKIGDDPRMNQRVLCAALFLTVIVGMVVAGYFYLQLMYTHGASNLQRWDLRQIFLWRFNSLVWRIRRPRFTDWLLVRWMGYGAVLMGGLYYMSTRFYWWPFHPLGLLMANTYPMECFWFSIFVGWFLKSSILKYGGGRTYKNMRPFFLGLILGEAFIAGIWAAYGFYEGRSLVSVLP